MNDLFYYLNTKQQYSNNNLKNRNESHIVLNQEEKNKIKNTTTAL